MLFKKFLFFVVFISLISGSALFPVSDDFVMYKKIKISDPNVEIVSINDCVFDADDNIYINAGIRIHKLDSKGTFLGTIIKSGHGPEEIERTHRININETKDRIVVFDIEKQKTTLFDLNGKYIQTMDSPAHKIGLTFASNELGDYYFYFREKKGGCQIYHLDKHFVPLECFYPNNGIQDIGMPWFVSMDFDSKSNVYVLYPQEYKIYVYKNNGTFLRSFADPGGHYNKPLDYQPTPDNRDKLNEWYRSLNPLFPIYVLENRAVIVFYQAIKKNSPKYYDLYTLEGKRISSGTLDEGLWPIGKDRNGRLVCAKTEISADGTDVTYWLHVYSINQSKFK